MDLLSTTQADICQKIPSPGCVCGLVMLQHSFMEDDATINHCGCDWGKTGGNDNKFLSVLKCFCENCLLHLKGSPIANG